MRTAYSTLFIFGYVIQASWAALPSALRLSSTEKDATIREVRLAVYPCLPIASCDTTRASLWVIKCYLS
jgi:hypothetical protein